jgi:hypothetical protein
LTSELIYEDKSTYYLEWLEEIDRAKATKALLERKAKEQAKAAEAAGADGGQGILKSQVYDPLTAKRRKEIFDKINKRKS